MGMFDTLRCDYPLPDPEFQERTFHTNDLGCLLDHYRIDTDGRLRQIRRKLHVPRDDRAVRQAPESEDTHYHGDLRFYANTAKEQVEYQARFTHGVVEWIRRQKDQAPEFTDTLEQLARDARYLEQEREAQLERLLQRLKRLDPEGAKRTVRVFDDRGDAALWLTTANRGLADLTPYQALAQGKRQDILDTLWRIEYGVYS